MKLRDSVYVKYGNFDLMKVNVAIKKGSDKDLSRCATSYT